MKPIIIKVDKDDNVTMKLSEFQKHLDDAYYQGRIDGENSNWWRYTYPPITTTPTITWTTEAGTSTEGTTIHAKNVHTAGSTTAAFTPNTTTE